VELGFGCVNLGSAGTGRSPRADIRLVHAALDAGVRVFDTAGAYGNGASERLLGRALRGRRDDVVLATKGGYVFRERSRLEQAGRRHAASGLRRARALRQTTGTGAEGGATAGGGAYVERDDSPHHLRAAVEASLRRLRTDHIDVYQLHGPKDVHPQVFDELQDLVDAGKVGRFGIGAESVAAAVAWLEVPAVATVQVPFGVLDPEAADELFPRQATRPVEIWARGVLGGGLLAAVTRDPDAAASDPKGPMLARLGELAARTGRALDDLAIAYVRSFTEISTMLIGIGSHEHLARNLALVQAPPLTDDARAELAAIAAMAAGGADVRA
jgi:aryl-alcohol dehydrogenase-like predicted oxidoreductase